MKGLIAALATIAGLASTTALAQGGGGVQPGATQQQGSNAPKGVVFRPRVGFGMADYTLTITDNDTSDTFEWAANYNPLVVGASIIGQQFFFDISHTGGSGDAEFDGASTTVELDRSELALLAGMRVDKLSVYVGYLDAASDFSGPGGFGFSFNTSGLLFGLGGSFANIGKGSLSGGFGMALLSGEYEEPGVNLEADFTLGYSLTLGYSYPFNDRLSLKGDGKLNWYYLDFTTDADATADELLGSLIVSLAYAF